MNPTARVMLVTDTHFLHQNIIEWGLRPIFYEDMIQKELATLTEKDTLIHLGDICLGKPQWVHETYIMPLPCKKILVKGNHDDRTNHFYLKFGWDFVCRTFMDHYFGLKIMFSHRPLPWDGIYDLNIHGHLHDLGHRGDEVKSRHIMNHLISLELNDYRLTDLRKIVEKRINYLRKVNEGVKDEIH